MMEISIYAPCKGKFKDITMVNDKVFAEKMIGDGMAIKPDDSYVCAPMDGTVVSIYPTNHAFMMVNDEGVELMIHIGVDTVHLNKTCFKRLVQENQCVKRGEPIIKANFRRIRHHHFDDSVIVISINNDINKKNITEYGTKDTVMYVINK